MRDVQTLCRGRRRGQGLTEYIIIVAVVAILSISVVTQFGDAIRELFHDMAKHVVGKTEKLEDHMKEDPAKQLSEL